MDCPRCAGSAYPNPVGVPLCNCAQTAGRSTGACAIWPAHGDRPDLGHCVTKRAALARLREVEAIWHVCPPLSAKWRALLQFAADYYQRGLGEIALPALPGALRDT